MTKVTNLGIWMDHANAHLIEFNAENDEAQAITSKFTHEERERSLTHGEKTMVWRDQGYWLLLPLMMLALFAFRRSGALAHRRPRRA